VFTSLRVAGFTGEEAEQALVTGEVLHPDDFLQFQRLNPHKDWGDTLAALTTHPEHPPLYYGLVRGWMGLFGSSVAAMRSLSVMFSLLTFPVLYWLCLELFQSIPVMAPRIAWMAITLYAISPFHVLYAQEARQYSLWTLTIMLSSACLLRALKASSWKNWLAYGGAIALGIYTTLGSVLVYGVHGLYTFVAEKCRLSQTVWRFAASLLLGCATFIPWTVVVVNNWDALQAKTAWTKQSAELSFLAELWGLHLSSNFVDIGVPLGHPYNFIVPPLIGVMLVAAFYQLIRKTPWRVWLFVLLLTVIPAIALILPDLLLGGRRSASTRYFVPTLVGSLLAVSFLLADGLGHPQRRNRWLAKGLTTLLLTAGILSCSLSFSADTWWNKGVSFGVPRSARLINSSPKPLVIIGFRDVGLGNAIALSYLLKDDVRLQMPREPEIPEMPEDVSDRFLYYPSDALLQAFQEAPEFTLQPLEGDNILLIKPLANDATGE